MTARQLFDRLRLPLAWLWIALAALAWLFTEHPLVPKHLEPVAEGMLYRSAYLPPHQLESVVDRYGIKTVVNLRALEEYEEPGWYAEQAHLLDRKGVELLDLPMYSGWPPRKREVEAWLALLDDPERHPVLVHCEYGVVRTGTMVSLYEIEQLGEPADGAVERNLELFGKRMKEPIRSRIDTFLHEYEQSTDSTALATDG